MGKMIVVGAADKYDRLKAAFKIRNDLGMIKANELHEIQGGLSKDKPSDFLNSSKIIELRDAIISTSGKPEVEIVNVINGGVNRGTWMCPELAVEYCRWMDPVFGYQANQLIYAIATDVAEIKINKHAVINDIVIKIKAMKKKPNLRIAPLIDKMLLEADFKVVDKDLLPRIIRSIAGFGNDLKLKFLDKLEDRTRVLGNIYHAEFAKMTIDDANHADYLMMIRNVQKLLISIKEAKVQYLAASRGQSKRQLKAKIDKLSRIDNVVL